MNTLGEYRRTLMSVCGNSQTPDEIFEACLTSGDIYSLLIAQIIARTDSWPAVDDPVASLGEGLVWAWKVSACLERDDMARLIDAYKLRDASPTNGSARHT